MEVASPGVRSYKLCTASKVLTVSVAATDLICRYYYILTRASFLHAKLMSQIPDNGLALGGAHILQMST